MREQATLRSIILALVGLSALYALSFTTPIIQTMQNIVNAVADNYKLAFLWAVSVLSILFGHLIRAQRNVLLFRNATKTTTRTQLGAFSVGELCNVILPLKLGEFVRADVIAQRYKISYSFAFILICIERLLDALILLCFAFFFIGFYPALAAFVVIASFLITILCTSPGWFKSFVAFFASLLNERMEARVLFILWSLEYGLKRTIRPKLLIPYCVLAIFNWVIYFGAFIPILYVLLDGTILSSFRASIGAYIALTTAITPAALGSYSSTLANLGFSDPIAFIMLWMAAVIPISIIGLFFACFKLRNLPLLRPKETGRYSSPKNKLSRSADISKDQLSFLKDYYARRPLASKMSRDEIGGGPAVERYLSGGGSGAITYLADTGNGSCVTKLVPLERSTALRQQYNWLNARESSYFVRVFNEYEDDCSYSIDIAYDPNSIDCFEYIHSHPKNDCIKLLDSVIDAIDSEVWESNNSLVYADYEDAHLRVKNYIDIHIIESLELAQRALPMLSEIINADQIVANGIICSNIHTLLNKINSSHIIDDLSSFRIAPAIHGDLIIDNIIWLPSDKHAVILDPVPVGNFFDGPVFDFGKLCQSLHIGYEFMLRDSSKTLIEKVGENCISVSYTDSRSAMYDTLWDHVATNMAPRFLTDSERRTMFFIGATNFIRRMKHQASQCPENAPAFYAAGILHLNQYIRMFKDA